MPAPTTDEPTPVERALRVVTDIRSGEAPLSLALALNVFLLLTAYYLIKPVREALILALDSGAEYKSYMSAVIAVTLLVAVPAYARFVDTLPRLRLVVGVTLFFASHLVLFFLASQYEPFRRNLGLVFFVWVGVFNMMVVAQLWSFANDLFNLEQGKRLFALVALGGTLGAALGSKVASWLIGPLGVFALLLVAAAILAGCALLFVVSERLSAAFRRRSSGAAPAAAVFSNFPQKPKERPRGAFALVVRHRYLLAIALLTLVFSWANTNGEYMFGKLLKAAASDALAHGTLRPDGVKDFIGKAYADFFFAVNVLVVLLQAFVVSRIVKHGGGTGLGLFVLPLITLGSGLAVFAVPVLAVLRVGKTLENATDYSLNNTVRQMLWLPTSREMKYKAKQAVDTFFVRLGDVSSAVLVYVGAEFLSLSVRGFAFVNALLAAVWLFFAWRIRREGERLERPSSRAPEGAAVA